VQDGYHVFLLLIDQSVQGAAQTSNIGFQSLVCGLVPNRGIVDGDRLIARLGENIARAIE
jgi:hypothetical protein